MNNRLRSSVLLKEIPVVGYKLSWIQHVEFMEWSILFDTSYPLSNGTIFWVAERSVFLERDFGKNLEEIRSENADMSND